MSPNHRNVIPVPAKGVETTIGFKLPFPGITVSFFVLLVLAGCTNRGLESKETKHDGLHAKACSQAIRSPSPWSIANLYDCQTRTLYIPYQLWTGAEWDGSRNTSCMHRADSLFNVNNGSLTTIKGPEKWKNPKTGSEEIIWIRDKVNFSKTQYFVCHETSILFAMRKASGGFTIAGVPDTSKEGGASSPPGTAGNWRSGASARTRP